MSDTEKTEAQIEAEKAAATTLPLRGFAAMPREKVAEIGRQGGKAVAKSKTGHRFTPGADGTAAAASARARARTPAARRDNIGAEVGGVSRQDKPEGPR